MPDDAALAQWLDDELQGAELAACEARFGSDADLLERRAATRKLRALMVSAVPADVEPPYPDFFNQRIERAILAQRDQERGEAPAVSWWGRWWMPTAAAAGMVFSFWLGARTGGPPPVVAVQPVAPLEMAAPGPAVYTPERGVDAEWFSGPDATVIVLEGVDAIPDSLDFSETVGVMPAGRATAGLDDAETGEVVR